MATKIYNKRKGVLLEVICYLYVFLFVYAATSKLLVFDEFKIQIGQSHMLTLFTDVVAWGIPFLEILIALLLIIPRFRLLGMYASFCLMVMFTTYIAVILNFSDDIPCSCGGVIEKLGWTEHLIFNAVFVILAFIGIIILYDQKKRINTPKHTKKKLYRSLLIYTISSAGFIILLFVFTKTELERDTSFKRGFLYYPPKKIHELDLEYNGHYFAGAADGQIYLGYPRSPLYLKVLDTTLQNVQDLHLKMDKDSLPMRSPQVRVIPPYFFLMDGTIPYVLRGNTKDWKAHAVMEEPLYFTNAEPIDSVTLAIRSISSKTNEFALGTIKLSDSSKMTLSHNLLKKQVDGVFDVDGMLQYNKQQEQLIYTYRYRNQYIVANDSLQLELLGKTIDTISQAQIEVGTIASKNQQKLSAPAVSVNKLSTTFGKYLFINSERLGSKESEVVWKKSSVIDVYDMEKNSYQFSFYVDDIEGKKLKAIRVLNDKFFGLIGNHIVVYQLGDRFKYITPDTTATQSSEQEHLEAK
ncbi:MauE/DoxX family redox-associated membrane protein [Flavivirga eckloniae]|uniref:Methylamine utilisation protein MauE domain-containing protein n=1 Tax=Flavivirga eckloniae TaxID=1803846 RepID=A0A2K9PVE9_9FLAO|nr:MauE/DoxX family redox-associated membrane protein [Flavivirga eckloniae]AUP81043.1 hypothetical protein C1H87_20930 [Flavivirga eckloniae]